MMPVRMALRAVVLWCCAVVLAGCTDPGGVYAPMDQVEAARAAGGPPYSLTLVTNINNRSNQGAHSALIVNGPERGVFNPAGTWFHPDAPERGDFHYGFTRAMERWFIDYHARETYRVQFQTVEVTKAQARAAFAAASSYGTVPNALCTVSVSRVLQQVPGFEDFPTRLFPGAAASVFASYPGVETRVFRDDSPGDRSDFGPPAAVKAPET